MPLGSLISGSIGYRSASRNQRRLLNFEREQAEINRQFQDQQATRAMEHSSSEAGRAMDFSSAQAAAQMGFQERMSSTQYQRSADDLAAAGLNRILALGSPAPSGAGAMGSSAQGQAYAGSGAQGHAPGTDPTQAGLAAASAYQQVKNMREQNRLVAAQVENVNADTAGKWSTAEIKQLMAQIPGFINQIIGRHGSSASAADQVVDKLEEYIANPQGRPWYLKNVYDYYRQWRDAPKIGPSIRRRQEEFRERNDAKRRRQQDALQRP